MPNNFDYDAYARKYRANHPDKIHGWRYKTYLKYCLRYELENPARAAELRAKAEAEVYNA